MCGVGAWLSITLIESSDNPAGATWDKVGVSGGSLSSLY
jgi:hypothetical protein